MRVWVVTVGGYINSIWEDDAREQAEKHMLKLVKERGPGVVPVCRDYVVREKE